MTLSASLPQKFAFDLDLGKGNEKSRLIGESELASLLKSAEQKGFEKGFTDGERSAANRAATDLASATKNLVQRTVKIAQAADANQKQTLVDATDLGVATAKKLCANLITRLPLEEIRSLIAECFSSLENVPHLVIRCHPDLSEAIQSVAQEQMKTSGFEGRLVIMGEPEILLGDARLEWVDGGLVRDMGKISDQIDFLVKIFVDQKNSTVSDPKNTPSLENKQ